MGIMRALHCSCFLFSPANPIPSLIFSFRSSHFQTTTTEKDAHPPTYTKTERNGCAIRTFHVSIFVVVVPLSNTAAPAYFVSSPSSSSFPPDNPHRHVFFVVIYYSLDHDTVSQEYQKGKDLVDRSDHEECEKVRRIIDQKYRSKRGVASLHTNYQCSRTCRGPFQGLTR